MKLPNVIQAAGSARKTLIFCAVFLRCPSAGGRRADALFALEIPPPQRSSPATDTACLLRVEKQKLSTCAQNKVTGESCFTASYAFLELRYDDSKR